MIKKKKLKQRKIAKFIIKKKLEFILQKELILKKMQIIK
jgi:hypothetical protein